MNVLGTYPTPIERLESLDQSGVAVWVKRDDQTHPVYGGNKVRKLEHILPEVKRRQANRVVTVGAVGSHHVLATTLFGRQAGLDVDAVLVPQPRTAHVEANLRADLGAGLRAHAASGMVTAPFRLLPCFGEGAFFIPMGGSSPLGALGYVDAALELAEQIRSGILPAPDLVTVTLGSGGTAAGLAVGFAKAGLDVRVLGVCVATPVFAVQALVRWLIDETARLADPMHARILATRARSLLSIETSYLGAGYGSPTPEGDEATRIAGDVGLKLDPTYTAKTFAATLAHRASGAHRRILYWHTLSSAPLAPLLENAPSLDLVPAALKKLLR